LATTQATTRTGRKAAPRKAAARGATATRATTPRATTPRATTPRATTTRRVSAEARGRTRTTARAPAERPATEEARGPAREQKGGLVRLERATVPLVHTRVPVLKASVPDLTAWAAQAKWAARANLPPRDQLLYYGGLGLLAVVGVLEWPVAAAVGAGVWVAGRARRGGGARTAPA
jgi:hypothetical protein